MNRCSDCGTASPTPFDATDGEKGEFKAFWFVLNEHGSPMHPFVDDRGNVGMNYLISGDLDGDYFLEAGHRLVCCKCMDKYDPPDDDGGEGVELNVQVS